MKRIIDYIKQKNNQFSEAILFRYLQDKTVAPEQKLAFAPYMAHFVFSFMDINRFVLRDLQSNNELQKLVNIHTQEDADHWPWYLNDIKKMGFDKRLPLSEALHFIWGDHCIASRLLTYRMTSLIGQASDKEKIMIVEVIEMTGNVFLKHTSSVCAQMKMGDNYQYYGAHHYQRETGHHMGCGDIEEELNNICLTEDERKKGFLLVDNVYVLYQKFVDEMYEYAIHHNIHELKLSSHYDSVIDSENPEGDRLGQSPLVTQA